MIPKKTAALWMMMLVVSFPYVFSLSISNVQVQDILQTSAVVKWTTDVNSDGRVYIGETQPPTTQYPSASSDTTSHSTLLPGLKSGTTYYYYVTASATGQADASSATSSFTTLLGAVSLKVESQAQSSVKVSFSCEGAEKYEVRYKKAAESAYSQPHTVTATTHEITGLAAATTYDIEVTAVKGTARSQPAKVQATTQKPDIAISGLKASTAGTTAAVSWTTSIVAICTLYYGTDTNPTQQKASPSGTSHSVSLTGLSAQTRYYYKVKCQDKESGLEYFTTSAQQTGTNPAGSSTEPAEPAKAADPAQTENSPDYTGEDSKALGYTIEGKYFLKLTDVPKSVGGDKMKVTGETNVSAKLIIRVNSNPVAPVRETVNGAFEYEIRIDRTRKSNTLRVEAWDENGRKDQIEFTVAVDTKPPSLSLDKIPSLTNQRQLTVKGKTDGVSVAFRVKDRVVATVKPVNGAFSYKLSLVEGENEITVIAKNSAGNENRVTEKVTVDTKLAGIEFLTDFRGETHFKLFRIKGKTEPGAKVRVINYGPYSGCDDIGFKTKYGGCEKGVHDRKSYDRFISVVDPLTYGIGMSQEVTADEDGEFSVVVSLVSGADNTKTTNTIHFIVTDEAGNKKEYKKSIIYSPGCDDWTLGKVDSYPFNIYTRELAEGDIHASAFIRIRYLGRGVPKVTQVYVTKDMSNRGTLVDTEGDMTELIRIGTGVKASMYDEKNRMIYVHVPIEVTQYKGSIKKLPEQLNAYLSVRLAYGAEGESGAKCEVYPMVAFDVQKPELLTKWLSPAQINETIKALDGMINATQKISDFLTDVSMWGLVACGVMIVKDYVKGFFSSAEKHEGECTEGQEGMKQTFYVCDRILCPSVDPDCSDFTEMGDGKYYMVQDGKRGEELTPDEARAQIATNAQWRQAYNDYAAEQRAANKNMVIPPFDMWRTGSGAANQGEFGKYMPLELPAYGMEKKEGSDEWVHQARYFEVNDDGKIVSGDALAAEIVEARRAAENCKGGTIVEISSREKSKDGVWQFTMGTSEAVPRYECIQGKPWEIGPPDSAKHVKGCYNEECPKFDDTKCFGKDGIEPPGGLWSSATCVCLPGLVSHINNLLKILKGAKKCLEQAQIGEVRGGFCEKLLVQFVCDILIEAFKFAMAFGDGASGGTSETGYGGALSNYKENSQAITDTLSSRYGDIVNNKIGLSGDQLVHKACMFAFTWDLSLLEGVLDNIVEEVEVEPVATLWAESRSYGFDPFTGRMNINYEVTAGVVPGGETDVTIWVECDPNYDDARYCGAKADKKIVKQFHMSKNDPVFNENIMFTDQNAKWWYNKAVMVLEYKINNKPYKKTFEKKIWRKGDLGAQCTFSTINGITCEGFKELAPDGMVNLAKVWVSPPMAAYGEGQNIALMAEIENTYKKPAYFIIDYGDRKVQYTLDQSPASALQYYNFYLDTGLGTAQKSGNCQTLPSNQWSCTVDREKNGEVEFSLAGDYLNGLTAQITVENANKEQKTIVCRIPSESKAQDDLYKEGIYYNGEFKRSDQLTEEQKNAYCKKYVDAFPEINIKECTASNFQGDNYARYKNDRYVCIRDDDDLGPFFGRDVVRIAKVEFQAPIWKSSKPPEYTELLVSVWGIMDYAQFSLQKTQSQGTSGRTTKKAKVGVYYDSNGNGFGDTPIANMENMGDQTKEVSYVIGPAEALPRAEIVEPHPGALLEDKIYVNNEGKGVLFGLNALNYDKLTFTLANSLGWKCTWDKECSGTCDGAKISPGRTQTGGQVPPFVECEVTFEADKPDRGPTTRYVLTVEAEKGGKKMEPLQRAFTFDKSGQVTQEMLTVCLGGGVCRTYVPGVATTEQLGQFSSIGAPVGRS